MGVTPMLCSYCPTHHVVFHMCRFVHVLIYIYVVKGIGSATENWQNE
jgi:hypothetical protein